MKDGFWLVVDEFLAFVEGPEPLPDRDLPQLARLLDLLAVRAPCWDGQPPESDEDPPAAPPESERRRQLGGRFPDFGFYYTTSPVEPTGADDDGEATLADALDDVLDIARDLADAKWFREHGCEGDGERYAGQMFRYHWGRHLRDLQSYLHRRLHEA